MASSYYREVNEWLVSIKKPRVLCSPKTYYPDHKMQKIINRDLNAMHWQAKSNKINHTAVSSERAKWKADTFKLNFKRFTACIVALADSIPQCFTFSLATLTSTLKAHSSRVEHQRLDGKDVVICQRIARLEPDVLQVQFVRRKVTKMLKMLLGRFLLNLATNFFNDVPNCRGSINC